MTKKLSLISIFSGLISIFAGLYIVVNPIFSLLSFVMLFAIIFFIIGISECVKYFVSDTKSGWELFSGILTIILAISLLSSNIFEKISFVPFIFAFWAILTGISKFIMSFGMRKSNKKLGNTLLLTGILGIVVGIIMLGNPLMTGLFVSYTIAFILIYQGVTSIVLYFKSKN